MRAPAMLRDSVANRLGMISNDWNSVFHHCRGLSLKTQGLMARKTSVPLLSIGHRHDFLCPEQEIQALAGISRSGQAQVLDKLPLLDVYETALTRARDWLLDHL